MEASLRKTTLRSQELSCPSCVNKVEREVSAVDGVESVEVRYNSGRIIVEHDKDRVAADDLVAAVARAGYTAKTRGF